MSYSTKRSMTVWESVQVIRFGHVENLIPVTFLEVNSSTNCEGVKMHMPGSKVDYVNLVYLLNVDTIIIALLGTDTDIILVSILIKLILISISG